MLQPLALQVDIVGSCSVLELFILVAVLRIKRRGHESANFEMVHDEYCKLMEQGSSGDKRSKAAALRAFERLIAYRLVSYVDSRYFNTFDSFHCGFVKHSAGCLTAAAPTFKLLHCTPWYLLVR